MSCCHNASEGWSCDCVQEEQAIQIKKSNEEITQLKVRLKEAEEVIEFYGDVESWQSEYSSTYCERPRLMKNDYHYFDGHFKSGGRRAFKYLTKYKKDINNTSTKE